MHCYRQNAIRTINTIPEAAFCNEPTHGTPPATDAARKTGRRGLRRHTASEPSSAPDARRT